MAKILLNTRASRIIIAADILLLPAEVKDDERLGKVVTPSRTLISEQGDPSPYKQIQEHGPTQKLFQARIIEWSNERVDEPEPAADPRVGAVGLPRADQADKAAKQSGSDEADVDLRATIDESGRPLDEFALAEQNAARSNATSPTGGFRPRNATPEELSAATRRGERVSTSAEVEAAAQPVPAGEPVPGANPAPAPGEPAASAASAKEHKPKGSKGG